MLSDKRCNPVSDRVGFLVDMLDEKLGHPPQQKKNILYEMMSGNSPFVGLDPSNNRRGVSLDHQMISMQDESRINNTRSCSS